MLIGSFLRLAFPAFEFGATVGSFQIKGTKWLHFWLVSMILTILELGIFRSWWLIPAFVAARVFYACKIRVPPFQQPNSEDFKDFSVIYSSILDTLPQPGDDDEEEEDSTD